MTSAWRWGAAGVLMDQEVDGSREQLWIAPMLPHATLRVRHPLRVELLCWFANIATMNAGLRVVGDCFGRDSVLVAIRRRDDASRIVLYTAARASQVDDRYFAVRESLRPTAMGLVPTAVDPTWASLDGMLSTLTGPLAAASG